MAGLAEGESQKRRGTAGGNAEGRCVTDYTATDRRYGPGPLAGRIPGELVRRAVAGLRTTPLWAAADLARRLFTARILSSLGALFAAAMYGPQAFAFMGLYLGCVKLASLVLFLRYESAALAADGERDTLTVIRLCCVVAAAVGLVLLPVMALGVWLDLIPPVFVPLFIASVSARGLLRLGGILASRAGDFATLGRATTIQAIVQPLVLVALTQTHLHGATVMALSDIAGYGVAALVAAAPYRRWLFAALAEKIALSELAAVAGRWSGLPLLNLPGALFSAGFTALPLIALPFIVDHETAGYAALAIRVLEIPAHLVGAATTPILLHRLGAGVRGDGGRFAVLAVAALAAVATAVFGGAVAMSLAIDPWLSGTHWHGLAEIVPVLAVFYAGVTLAGPLTEVGGLFREQRLLAAINGIALAAALAAFALAGDEVGPALAAVAGLSLMRAGVLGARIVELAGRHGRRFAAGRVRTPGPVEPVPLRA